MSDLTKGSVRGHVIRLSIPLMIGMLSIPVNALSDAWFAGYISKQSLIALGLNFPIFLFVIAFHSGLSIASSIKISYFLGKKNNVAALNYQVHTLLLAMIFYLLVLVLKYFFLGYLIHALGVSGELYALAYSYASIILTGSIILYIYASIFGGLLAQGEGVVLRNSEIMWVVINIILNWYLVVVKKFGVVSLAYATILSLCFSLIYVSVKLSKSSMIREYKNYKFKFSFEYLNKLIIQSLPRISALFNVAVGNYILLLFIERYGGDVVAAFTICIRFEGFVILPSLGVGTALLAIMSQNYGAKLYSRLISTFVNSQLCILAINIICILIVVLFSEDIIHMFSMDPAIVVIAKRLLLIGIIGYIGYGVCIICLMTFQVMGYMFSRYLYDVLRFIILPVIGYWFVINYTNFAEIGIWYARLLPLLFIAIICSILSMYWLKKLHNSAIQ